MGKSKFDSESHRRVPVQRDGAIPSLVQLFTGTEIKVSPTYRSSKDSLIPENSG